MRKSLLMLAAALLPACAMAQGTPLPPVAPGGPSSHPRGPDTPVATVPGGTAAVAPTPVPSNDTPLPTVDSSGANRSSESATGEAKPPIGAPRLPGEPSNPPTGPSD